MKKLTVCLLATGLLHCYARAQNLNALHFDGVDDYVNLNVLQNDFYNNQTHFTIEFWMQAHKDNQTSSIRTTMFAINEPTGENRLLLIMGGETTQDGKLMVYHNGSWGANAIYISSQIIGDGNCHHIAYTYDNGNCNVYIDGILVDAHTTTYPITANDRYSLGQEYDNAVTSQFYNGVLDDVRIWSVVRTDAEIAAAMNNELSGNETGLIAYYNFNQGIDSGNNTGISTLNDATTANLDGTLFNFALNGSTSNWLRGLCVAPFLDTDEITNLNAAEIQVYPNPASSAIYLLLSASFQNQHATITLYSLQGQQVFSENQVILFNIPVYLPTEHLSPGTYLIEVLSEEQKCMVKVVLN